MNAATHPLRRPLMSLLAAIALSTPAASACAEDHCQGKRQCYSNEWKRRSSRTAVYYLQKYYFKTRRTDNDHKYHYLIYYPGDAWMYFYNPIARTYWCRASKDATATDGKIWIILPAKYRKGLLREIPDEGWDRRPEVPLIPGSDRTGDPLDREEMLTPPDPPKVAQSKE